MSALETKYFHYYFISLIIYMHFGMPVKKIWAIHFNSNNLLNKKGLMKRHIKKQLSKYLNQRQWKNYAEIAWQSLNNAPYSEELFISLYFSTIIKYWITTLFNERTVKIIVKNSSNKLLLVSVFRSLSSESSQTAVRIKYYFKTVTSAVYVGTMVFIWRSKDVWWGSGLGRTQTPPPWVGKGTNIVLEGS